jgi:hypothetical protein
VGHGSQEQETIRRNDLRIMEERRPVEFEETFTGGDGVARVFRTVKAPLLNPAGVVIGLVGLSGEVTESRRARDELGRLNAHLEERVAEALAERKLWADVFEATDAFIAVVGPDLRLLALTGPARGRSRGWAASRHGWASASPTSTPTSPRSRRRLRPFGAGLLPARLSP